MEIREAINKLLNDKNVDKFSVTFWENSEEDDVNDYTVEITMKKDYC